MSIIAFIPVRGGSKSIPFKNIKEFCGKPLVCWNIEALEKCKEIDEIIVATDSKEIEDAVLQFSYKKTRIYHRLPENANDTASTESVMLEYLQFSKCSPNDLFILVQATSPFTQTADFYEALKMYELGVYDSILTCVRFKRFFWNKNGTSKNYDFKVRPRRQDFEGELMENGAFYINKVVNILETKNRLSGSIGIYEMPEFTALEIDEMNDWIVAEKLMRQYIMRKNKF